jgi:hypothetical protein
VIEALVRLVEEQHARIRQQRQREVQLLSRSAGQITRPELLPQGKSNSARIVPAPEALVAGHAGTAGEHHEVIIGREQLEQPGGLRAVPDATAHTNRAVVGAQQPGADAQQRRLPGAVLTGERDDLAGTHREGHVVEDDRPPVALLDAGGDELMTGKLGLGASHHARLLSSALIMPARGPAGPSATGPTCERRSRETGADGPTTARRAGAAHGDSRSGAHLIRRARRVGPNG